MPKVRLHPPVKSMSGKMGIYTYRVMYGKQTIMKTPDTPALARRCKCVQCEVEQGAEGKPGALSGGDPLRQTGDGKPGGPCAL